MTTKNKEAYWIYHKIYGYELIVRARDGNTMRRRCAQIRIEGGWVLKVIKGTVLPIPDY